MNNYSTLLQQIRDSSTPTAWARFTQFIDSSPRLREALNNAANGTNTLVVRVGDPGSGRGAVYIPVDPNSTISVNVTPTIIIRPDAFSGTIEPNDNSLNSRISRRELATAFAAFQHEFLGHFERRNEYSAALVAVRDTTSGIDAETRALDFARTSLKLEAISWLESYRALETADSIDPTGSGFQAYKLGALGRETQRLSKQGFTDDQIGEKLSGLIAEYPLDNETYGKFYARGGREQAGLDPADFETTLSGLPSAVFNSDDGPKVIAQVIGEDLWSYSPNQELIFDDGSSVTSRFFDNGSYEIIAKDTNQRPTSLTVTTPNGINGEVTDNYRYGADGRPVIQSSTSVQYFYDESGTSRTETITTYGLGQPLITRIVYNSDGTIFSSEPIIPPTNPASTTGFTSQQGIAVLNNVASFITAIHGGQPLPVATTGFNLLNTVTTGSVPVIANVSTVFNGLTSLYNLSNALQNGDTLTRINASLNTLNYVNSTLPTLLNAGPLSYGLNTVLNGSGTVYNAAADGLVSSGNFNGILNGGTPGVIPVLGLILSIRSGDPIGIISGLIGILNPALLATPPVGWILAGASILRALFGNKAPPEAWGTGKFILDANGNIAIDVVGESFGRERVSQQLRLTQQILGGLMAQALAISPGTPLGLIAQRTPILTWREARQSDKGYAIVDIDPVTGTQRYPYLRFDDNGVPFSSNPAVWQPDPLDEGIRISMTEQLLNSALRRQAIAPQWEVDTANYYIFNSCLRTIDGRSGRIGLSKTAKHVSYSKPAEPVTNAKAIKPVKPACVQVAASGVCTARSWWGTTNRSQCKRLTQLRMGLGGEAGRARENSTNSQSYYAIDSCLRKMDSGYRHKAPLNQAANEAEWGMAA